MMFRETGILEEAVDRSDSSGLLSATQKQIGSASSRELVSQALQQGLESLEDGRRDNVHELSFSC
jgi:hypothetical protein